ncbi:MAG: transcriptional repressor [Pirellulaceae bacterium]|jgi:Fur family ferric uptake transcriptional regulator|nr:transcriptional repressor [Pirellulaceae bacterium]
MRPSSIDPAVRLRWREVLHSAGIKCTEQRLAVLCELEHAVEPVSHREMLARLADYHWDPATIFRNLNDLCDVGLVRRIDVGDHVWRFELRSSEAERAEHPHFLCVQCGTITCLHEVAMNEALGPLRTSQPTLAVEEVLLKGKCPTCHRPA